MKNKNPKNININVSIPGFALLVAFLYFVGYAIGKAIGYL